MGLKFCTSVDIVLKLKVIIPWRLIITFVEVTGKNTERGKGTFALSLLPSPILNKVKVKLM